eukprot:47747-Chlamydomonas_euryale.AAC.5
MDTPALFLVRRVMPTSWQALLLAMRHEAEKHTQACLTSGRISMDEQQLPMVGIGPRDSVA